MRIFGLEVDFSEQCVKLETAKTQEWRLFMTKFNTKTFGYCRVSSTDQNEDRQI